MALRSTPERWFADWFNSRVLKQASPQEGSQPASSPQNQQGATNYYYAVDCTPIIIFGLVVVGLGFLAVVYLARR